jgi:hypothetical protein
MFYLPRRPPASPGEGRQALDPLMKWTNICFDQPKSLFDLTMSVALLEEDYKPGDPVTVSPTDEYRRQLQRNMRKMTEVEHSFPFPISYISPRELVMKERERRETISSSGDPVPVITEYFVGRLMKRSTTPLSLLKPSP